MASPDDAGEKDQRDKDINRCGETPRGDLLTDLGESLEAVAKEA